MVRLFSQGERPLSQTHLYPGDTGLFGPNSVSWKVMGDVASFVGGVRALLLQALHPEVAAGVADHSEYESDPLGRLNRTSSFVTTVNYGATREVDLAIQRVKQAHQPVSGFSGRGIAYSASDPSLGAWVQNTLTDSFLDAYQRFCCPLTRPTSSSKSNPKSDSCWVLPNFHKPQGSFDLGLLNIPPWRSQLRLKRHGIF